MAQGKPRDRKRERLWRRHLREQQLSGLTARDFCSLHQLAESTFHFWRREIARRDDEQQQATSAHREPASDRLISRATEPAFVPVSLAAPPRHAESAIDIRLSNGQRLRVRDGCDRQLLTDVVAVLEGRSC
jgi:transposase